MKGQSSIEYIVAMVIFVIFTIYISFQVANSIPYYHTNSLNNRLHSDCFRITENMLKDSKLEYGFAKEPYDLNYTKLYEFNETCNEDPTDFENVYKKIKDNMTLEMERDFQLRVYVNNTFNFICGRKYIPSHLIVASIERYAVTNGQPTSIKINVW
ncbi:MAG: hypothetical protein KAT37_01660 [Candidatus Aenigmarchaeota archaeon]|nr:hypothetical protein [Candidatus Aenigmarchaeota archaeon]